MRGQSDMCWTVIVMDFNVYWAAMHACWWVAWTTGKVQGRRPGMAVSVTEAQSHDEGRGG